MPVIEIQHRRKADIHPSARSSVAISQPVTAPGVYARPVLS
jgi:hypothetical protein